ncbi:MAG: hypothetical protein V1861_02060 [Candidatus Micrarchaeota archaeon]
MKKILMSLFILFAASFATNVNNAHYTGSAAVPEIYFDTDMQFTSDFTLSLLSGDISSGDPNNLQTGDEVCSGATLRVVPTVSTKWATPDLDTVALYYTCYGGYCPAMISYGTVNSNRNIAWLSSATWNSQKSFGDSNDYSVLESDYNTLGVSNFHTQTVSYANGTGIYSNKEGGAGMFCKGTFQVVDGATVKGSSAMPSAGNVDFAVNSVGGHAISTQLSGVNCFPVVVKHPTNLPDNPSYFLMTYFTDGPSIASPVATDTITVQVVNSGGDCSFYDVLNSVSASSSLLDEDLIMVKVTMHNSGDPVRITSVSSSNPDFTASAFPVAICDMLGFPPSLCPAANGFNSDIASGANKNLYVLVQRGPGASGGTILTFNGQTVAATCGSTATCNHPLDLTGAVTCEVQPPALEVATLTVAEYTVTCEDLAGDPTPCVGTNWYWNGIVGDFMEKTNTHAWAYATSPPGTSGTLNYHSGIANCFSDVDVTDDGLGHEYECEFIPASATMNISTSKYFVLNCFVNSTPSVPDDAEYDHVNGLGGSTSNSSVHGTTYTAPGSPDSGDLQGFASWASMPDPMVGKMVFAPITVVNGTSGNVTVDPDNPGASEWCTIGTGILSVFPGSHGWVGIMCGEHANETCASVVWTTEGNVSLFNADTHGTEYTITGDPNTNGKIQAYVGGDPTHSCYLPFYIAEPECWEYT